MLKLSKEKRTFKIPYRVDSGKSTTNPEGVGELLATFIMRPITPKRLREISLKHTEYEWDAPDPNVPKTRFEKIDFTAITYDRVCEMIVGWEDVVDDDDQPRTCDDHAKADFFETYPQIFNYLADRVRVLMGDVLLSKDAESKN
jgi:hypothetical protein